MPRYEFMYILSSNVGDDQLPEVAGQILQYVTEFGGTNAEETQLGKKKLAYPIKKTRNGFYGVIDFEIDAPKVMALDAKIRTDNRIIRYILVNMEEYLERSSKDREVQAKMNRARPAEMVAAEARGEEVVVAPKRAKVEVAPITEIQLEEEIEKALTEDITK